MNFISIFLLIHFYGFYHVMCKQWEDPHEMISGAKIKLHQKLKKTSSLSDLKINENVPHLDLNIYGIHFKRIINLLLNSANIDKSDPNLFHGHLMFDITPTDLKYLLNLGNEELNVDTLRRVDTIFSESFSKSLVESYLENLMTIQAKLYLTIVNVHNLWLLGTCFMLYIVYQLFKNNFSLGYIIKYLIIVVFIFDFGLRYNALLEEAEEHNLKVDYSPLCDTAKMTWSDYFSFLTRSRDCERKTVTPLDAFLYQIKNLIIIPMHAVGTGMGGFVINMFDSTPWGFGWFLFPIMLIFTLLVLIFLMIFITNKEIEINCFHLFKMKFGNPGSRESNNMLSGKFVERLMDKVLHRPLVQDVGAAGDIGAMNRPEVSDPERKEGASRPEVLKIKQNIAATLESSEGPSTRCNGKHGGKVENIYTEPDSTNVGRSVKVVENSESSHLNIDNKNGSTLASSEEQSTATCKAQTIENFNTSQLENKDTRSHLESSQEKSNESSTTKSAGSTKGTQTQFMKYEPLK